MKVFFFLFLFFLEGTLNLWVSPLGPLFQNSLIPIISQLGQHQWKKMFFLKEMFEIWIYVLTGTHTWTWHGPAFYPHNFLWMFSISWRNGDKKNTQMSVNYFGLLKHSPSFPLRLAKAPGFSHLFLASHFTIPSPHHLSITRFQAIIYSDVTNYGLFNQFSLGRYLCKTSFITISLLTSLVILLAHLWIWHGWAQGYTGFKTFDMFVRPGTVQAIFKFRGQPVGRTAKYNVGQDRSVPHLGHWPQSRNNNPGPPEWRKLADQM